MYAPPLDRDCTQFSNAQVFLRMQTPAEPSTSLGMKNKSGPYMDWAGTETVSSSGNQLLLPPTRDIIVSTNPSTASTKLPYPRDIVAYLDEYVIGELMCWGPGKD